MINEEALHLLTMAIQREINLFIMTQGQTDETLCAVLKAIALNHVMLVGDVNAKSNS